MSNLAATVADATAPPTTTEARRLHGLGFKLCELHRLSKRPVGNGWQVNPVEGIKDSAGGYGMLLALNGRCSIDPDNIEPAREGLARCGFDLEKLMGSGVRTSSTRPGSGGRSTFKAPPDLKRIVFSSKTHGTILELRAGNSNLQDCLPGTEYAGEDGTIYRQEYSNGKTFDKAPPLPPKFLAWWRRCQDDIVFLREQQALLCGRDAALAVSTGGTEGKGAKLAFSSPYRVEFNAHNAVTDILARHGYTDAGAGRWAPATATGTPCVRQIPGRDGLWQSDHASDPLIGTFDAWTAYVVLDHAGDLAGAENAWRPKHEELELADFEDGTTPEAIAAQEATEAAIVRAKAARFTPEPWHQFANGTPPTWIIKGILPQAGLGVIYGEPGSGKSFFTLDMVAAVARGEPWRNHKAAPGRVVYIAAEGVGGFRSRVAALAEYHSIGRDDMQLDVIAQAPDLMGTDHKALAAAIGKASIVVVDTLAQTTPGANENSGEDMGRALGHCKALHEATGALVLLVHHSGKDKARGARGWSGLRGACDVELEVTHANGLRMARISKQKDGESGVCFPFKLQQVAVGVDEDGMAVTSCVVVETDRPPEAAPAPKGKNQQAVLAAYTKLAEFGGTVPREALILQAIELIPPPEGDKEDRRRDTAVRALKGLIDDGWMVESSDGVHLA